MKRIFKLIILFLFVSNNIFGQGSLTIEPHQINVSFVDSILNRTDSIGTIQRENELKKAIYIAEELLYHDGVIEGHQFLSNHYFSEEKFSLQLRLLLLYSTYLEHHDLLNEQKINYFEIGNIYYQFDLFEKAKNNYKKADANFYVLESRMEIKLQKQLCLSYYYLQEFDSVLFELQTLIGLGRIQKDWNTILWSKQLNAKIAHSKTDYNTELEIKKEIIELTDSLNLDYEKEIAINNLAYTYKYLNDFESAKKYLLSILSNDTSKINGVIYQNLAILNQNENKHEDAKFYLNKARTNYSLNSAYPSLAYILDLLSLLYYQEGDFYNAQKYNLECIKLAERHKIGDVYQDAYYSKSIINQGLYEYEDALTSMNMHLFIKDSLETIKNSKTGLIQVQQLFLDQAESEIQLKVISEEVKDLEIKRLQAEKLANEEQLKRYESDSLFSQQKLITQLLKIKEIENLLSIQKQTNQIQLLDEQKKKQALDLQLEQAKSQEKEKNLLLATKNNEILGFELEQRQAIARNMTYFSIGLIIFVIVIIIFYLNVRKKKKEIDKQRILVAEERDKADALLLNILPVAVAEELKEKGKSPPRHLDMISIVFTDFAGFTAISEKLSPVELVEKLDEIFLEFDLIVENNGLNRIKTIGDAYMCAAGLPEFDSNHAENAVNTAIEMRNFIVKFNASLPTEAPKWNIRIGINSGSVVAGVVGVKKFAYDIWGDSVNVASRMESSGEINKVNISDATYQIVKDKFSSSYRGKIYAKNKGNIDMYFVDKKST